jgi:hypothetical protein
MTSTDLHARVTGAVTSILGGSDGEPHPDVVRLVEDVLAQIAAKDILVTGGRILAVHETDWRDVNEDGQTWTVYTELNGDA